MSRGKLPLKDQKIKKHVNSPIHRYADCPLFVFFAASLPSKTPSAVRVVWCHALIFSHSLLSRRATAGITSASPTPATVPTLSPWWPFGFHYAANQSRAVWFR